MDTEDEDAGRNGADFVVEGEIIVDEAAGGLMPELLADRDVDRPVSCPIVPMRAWRTGVGADRLVPFGDRDLGDLGSAMTAGRSSPRTIVASRKIATARPTPSCFIDVTDSVANVEKTATITIAALVITPAE